MTEENYPTLLFPYGFDERIAFEAEQRGVYHYAVVQLPGGDRVRVGFYDANRITQDLEIGERREGCCVAIPGMIVIPKITRECMEGAVRELYRGDYFDHLMRLPQEDQGDGAETQAG